MRRVFITAGLTALVAVASVAAQDVHADRHQACYAPGDGTTWTIYVDASASSLSRATTGADPTTKTYATLVKPADDAWPGGVDFATTNQNDGGFFPTAARIETATWSRSDYNRQDTMTFTTEAGVAITFSSTACASWNNCPGKTSAVQTHCWTDESCCGYGAISPKCIPNESGQQCCSFYSASGVCNATQSCCGGGGPGASSYTFCCGEGSTCCYAMSSTGYANTCCAAGTTCCGGSSWALCCKEGEVCDAMSNVCRPSSPTTTTTTAAPTTTTTTAAPPATVPSTLAPGERRACMASGSIYYDIRTGPTGTTLQRWSNGQMLDSNWYATLHAPAAGTTTWDEGVAYGATMQTRNVWATPVPPQSATWEVVNGEDIWRFSTTLNGAPTQLVFRTSSCVAMTPAPTTAAPPTVDPNGPHRACLTYGAITYNVLTSASGTTLERRANGAVIDTNWYATLHVPTAGTTTWDEGVAYAATMQTRNVWINAAPTSAATWEVVNGEDIWRFSTTMNGTPTQLVFRTSNCAV